LGTKPEASLRHHAEAETATLSAASRLLASALRGNSKTAPALPGTSGSLLTAALRSRAEALTAALHHSKTKALRAALCASAEAATLRSALEGSGLLSAKRRLSIHDSGCSDSGEKDSGDCKCKNLVHSSLLDCVVCGFRCYFIGSSSRIFKNASFPPIQRPASKKISF